MNNKSEVLLTINLTQTESDALINLLDIATKASGLNVAQSALFYVSKLQHAFKERSAQVSPVEVLPG